MSNYTDKQQREVFHLLFLERLFRISDPALYSLKGGINLRFFFNSPRYSEDMDLDVFGGSVETLKKNGYKILNDPSLLRMMQTYGVEGFKINDPSKAKQTETTQRFKLSLVNQSGEEFPTKVEFSRREKQNQKNILFENISPEIIFPYQRLSFQARHYHSDLAVVQKIQALGGRAEVQARDVFDLYILFLGGRLQSQNILSQTTDKERTAALTALIDLDFESYLGHVVEYLEPDAKKDYESEKKWNEMCDVVSGFLDEPT
jgi:predicted nucleotidyltransferase component of viral defense system